MLRLVFIVLIAMVFAACPPDDEDTLILCPNAQLVEIKNMSDLEGCQWVLTSTQLDFIMEPTNLEEYVSEPSAGLQINIEFEFKDDLASICMAGRIVEITCIRD